VGGASPRLCPRTLLGQAHQPSNHFGPKVPALPERTTPGGGRVAQPVLPAPPPPSGHGERLAAWATTRYARWRELVAGLVIMVALMAPIVGWYRTPASWIIAACTIGPGWLLGIYGFPPRSIGVGADWLRVRSPRSDDWVQTNQLVRLALEIRWTNRYLVMEDRDGRKLRVHLAELRGDRRVFAAFLSGVRHARSTGLTLNKATAMELGLH
jgi:hypothetical protein